MVTNAIIDAIDIEDPDRTCDDKTAASASVLSLASEQVLLSETEYPNWHSSHFSALYSSQSMHLSVIDSGVHPTTDMETCC